MAIECHTRIAIMENMQALKYSELYDYGKSGISEENVRNR